MKKLVCLGLAALLAVQTTACGVNAQESTAKNEELVVEDVGVTEDKLPERNLKDDRLEQVTESGKLLIGISPDYAPFAFETTDEEGNTICAGSDVELGKYLAEELDVQA